MEAATATAPPNNPQWARALQRANAVRLARADLKKDIRRGLFTLPQLLDDPPPQLHGVPVVEFLTWLPGIGRKRALRIVKGLILTESLTVDNVSPATRVRLVRRVQHYQPTRHLYSTGHYGAGAVL